MASMLNVKVAANNSGTDVVGNNGGQIANNAISSQIQTHYRTAYGPGSFQQTNSLNLQGNQQFKRSNFDSSLKQNSDSNGSRIKVAVRVRPLLENEKSQGHTCSVLKYTNNNEIQIGGSEDGGIGQQRAKSFKFDQVFNNESTQVDLYNGLGISNLVTKVIEGYHSTIFAYGQTGSGKTFTMEGYDFVGDAIPNKTKAIKAANDSENIGIIQRSIFELYSQIQIIKSNQQQQSSNSNPQPQPAGPTKHYSVFCSFLQIYNEKVFDLLNSSSISSLGSKKVAGGTTNNNIGNNANGNAQEVQKMQQGLRIRWTKKDQFVVENLYVFECQTPEEAIELFRFGSKNRILASHNLNDLSSRSHTIFTLTVESQDLRHGGESITVSKLQLVDLAGSEKQGLTGTTGQQAKESIDINKSLLVLRKVITALTEQKGGGGFNGDSKMSYLGGGGGGFIPYRESKLTCLLKQSLGGNSYTLMIACLSPSDRYVEENLSTLNYAAKASLISNLPTKNIDPRLLEITEFKKRIQDLEKELRNANDHIQFLTQLNDDKAKKILNLESQMKMIQTQDPQLLKTLSSQDDSNIYGITGSKLPSISTKNSNAQSHHIKQMRSEVVGRDELNLSDITQTDIELSQIPSSAIRSIVSPNKSGHTSQLNTSMLSNSNTQQQQQQQQLQLQQQINQKRQTQLNFFLQKDKEKQDAAAERLIHSVNAVTDLLKANTELRETIEKLKNLKEEVDSDNFSLQIENQSLRERLELVEGILKNNKTDYDNMVSDRVMDKMIKSNTQYGKFNMNATMDQPPTTIDAVYTELIQLRHKNKALEGRIKQLEVQNFRITNQGFNTKTNPIKQIKNSEPLRPMFRASSVEGTPLNSDRQVLQEQDEEDDQESEADYGEESEANIGVGNHINGGSNYQQYSNHQPSTKQRSFIVTIDEHNPPQRQTGLIKKRIIKKSALEKQRRINPNQIVMARGDPYLKKLSVNQNITPVKSREQIHSQMPPPSSQSQLGNPPQKELVPDQRFYTKTNFYTVNNQNMSDDMGRAQYNQSAINSEKNSPYSQNEYIESGAVGGAVQPPKTYNQPYESDFNSQNEINRRNNPKLQLEPITEQQQMRNVTDVDFKNYQKFKKMQQFQQLKPNSNHRDNSLTINNSNAANLSMVMVMSNLMSKRSNGNPALTSNSNNMVGNKKKSQSQSASNNAKKKQYNNTNDFYF